MERIKVGVIGIGMGRLHMEGYAKDSRAEILAICDLNKKEAEEFGEKYNVKYVLTDYKEMLKLEELDAVSIAVPNYLHAPMSIDALKAGKNVLCEKPMATNLKDAQAMVDAAEKAGKRLMINMCQRFHPAPFTLKKFIKKGLLGKIYYGKSAWLRRKGTPVIDMPTTGIMGRGEWFVQKDKSGGGALMDIGVHMYDVAWWLMGSPKPVFVSGSTYAELTPERFKEKGIFADVEELASAFVKFENGATLLFEVSWDSHMEPEVSFSLFGDKGGAKGSFGGFTIFTEKEGSSINIVPQLPKEGEEGSYSYFVSACLSSETEMIASGKECLEVIKVLGAIMTSAREKRSINL